MDVLDDAVPSGVSRRHRFHTPQPTRQSTRRDAWVSRDFLLDATPRQLYGLAPASAEDTELCDDEIDALSPVLGVCRRTVRRVDVDWGRLHEPRPLFLQRIALLCLRSVFIWGHRLDIIRSGRTRCQTSVFVSTRRIGHILPRLLASDCLPPGFVRQWLYSNDVFEHRTRAVVYGLSRE